MSEANQDKSKALRLEIIADAERQRERLLRRARTEGEQLVAKAREDAAAERERLLAEAAATAKRRSVVTMAVLPVDLGRMRSGHIESLLEILHGDLKERLAGQGALKMSREILLRLLAEAIEEMEGVSFRLRLTEQERQLLGTEEQWLPRLRAISGKEALKIAWDKALPAAHSGVVVSDEAGRQIWDNRLAARLERMWPALRVALAERLEMLG